MGERRTATECMTDVLRFILPPLVFRSWLFSQSSYVRILLPKTLQFHEIFSYEVIDE